MPDLKEIAEQIKENDSKQEAGVEIATPIPEEVADTSVEATETNDDEAVFFAEPTDDTTGQENGTEEAGDHYAHLKDMINANREVPEADDMVDGESAGYTNTSMNEYRDRISKRLEEIKVPANVFNVELNYVYNILLERRKQLLIEGLEGVDIDEALEKKLDKELAALTTKYTGQGSTVVINVPESTADKIEFSEEDQRKIRQSTRIEMVRVKQQELPVTKIKKLNKSESKLKFIHAMNDSHVSRYSVPLPLTGEFATFRGAILVELLQARAEENEHYQNIANKKASLAYKHYVEGVNYKKIDEKGTTVMSYVDFINHFRYHDLDLMVYAVACATSAPMTAIDLKCSNCGHDFKKEFPVSSLLSMDHTPEKVKTNYKEIIKNHTNLTWMETLKVGNDELDRFQSPITGNIYDIGSPSIARGIDITGLIDMDDATEIYIGSIGMFVHGFFVLDKENDEYIQIEADEYTELLEALQSLPQSELSMLHQISTESVYAPKFIMESKCPGCGRDLRNDIPVNDLVFFLTPEETPSVAVLPTK